MGRKRSVLEHKKLKIYAEVSVGLLLIYFAQVSLGATSSTDGNSLLVRQIFRYNVALVWYFSEFICVSLVE